MARLTGNVYVDSSYTEAITGTTHAITGEVLEFNVNAFASGGTTSNIPAIGGTIFYNNVDRLGSSIYNDGTYDMVLINTRSNYLYAVPKEANKTYSRDIVVQVEGGTHQHLAILGRSGNVKLVGDLTFTAKNVTLGTQNANMGGGDSDYSDCLILGNITFSLSDCTTGGSFYVHCGSVGSADQKVQVTGTVTNFLSTSAFRGIRTGGSQGVYGDFDLTISGSSFSNDIEFGYIENANATWEGEYTMTLSAVTAANIYAFGNVDFANRPAGENKFTLNVAAAENATLTAGIVDKFDVVNVAAGATLAATTINNAEELNITVGGLVRATDLNSIGVINVVGDLVQSDTVIISGLTATELNTQIYVGDVEYSQGKFPGFYEIVNGDLIIHNATSTVLLVNSNYTDGAATTQGPKGYSTFAKAQAAVTDKDSTTVMLYALDYDTDPNVFTEDVVTKDYATSFVGDANTHASLDGFGIVVGDPDADVESANVSISYTDNINSVSFGNVTGTATVNIDNSGKVDDEAIGTIDLTGAVIANAQISVSNSNVENLKLSDQEESAGKITVLDSTIGTVYGGPGMIQADLTGNNEITDVYAEGYGAQIKLAGSHVVTYTAGSEESGKSFDTLTYNDAVSADTLIIGGKENAIGQINATVTGGEGETIEIGGDGDVIAGDVDFTMNGGKYSDVKMNDSATKGGAVTVNLGGGTTAQRSDGVFHGLIYGASVTHLLDGGTEGTSRNLNVVGNVKVYAITNFDSLVVSGGTLNVAGGTDKTELSSGNSLEINGDILNRRGINAGTITANSLINYGVVGTLRDASNSDLTGITLSGNFENYDYVMTAGMEIDGAFVNTGRVSATGDISVGDVFTNSGELFFKAISTQDGTFMQDGGLILNNVDLVNTGFISAGSLEGVNNLTTSKMYVTGGAEISGNITIEAGAEVAFTNKANDSVENGLTLGGSIYMADTSRLVVSGELNTEGTKTITVNVGDLVGSQEIVRAEGGVNDWTIKLNGAKKGLYSFTQTDTSVVIYSLDQLFVNSAFSADSKIVVDGNTLVFGINAFASVADAVAAAKSGAKIIIAGDKTGMDVAAAGFDVVLDDAIVGDVTAKNLSVTSDSKVNSIASATGLTIDAGAVLSVVETIPAALPITIDASNGTGSRLVLDVDSTKVALNAANVTVIGPAGKAYTAKVLEGEGETAPAHAGDLYVISSDWAYFIKGNPTFVDGDTFDAATGDALFNGVNVFATREEAEAAAAAAGADGVLVLVGFTTNDNQKGSSSVTTSFEFVAGGTSGLYGTDGSFYEGGDHTTLMIGSTVGTAVYALNRAFNTSGNYTLLVKDSVFYGNNFFITGNTYGSVMNGNIHADIIGSTIANGNSLYIGYGNFGTDELNPIDIDVHIKDSRIGAFRGINMSGSTATQINANINITVLDSTFDGHFYVINTADWVANAGANIYQSTFTAGSINVTLGGTSVNNTLRPGDSLTHGANALQVFNAPATLHIVATEKSAVTQADWVMEWDTIIIDADARLELGHNLQFQTAYRGENVNAFNGHDLDLDMAGTPVTILVNMSGYQGGTHTVITAGEIYTDKDLSSIAVIGDNDLTGQCQLIYSGFRQIDSRYVLSRIAVFDKTDDMYVNAAYGDSISGTTVGGQELFFGGNAHSDFDLAIEYASEWGGTIVVTGGNFEEQDFEGNNVDFQNGTIGAITMGSDKAGTIKVSDSAKFTTADGSGVATLEAASKAKLGSVSDFATIKFAADATITAASLDLSNSSLVIDVDGFTGSSHIVLTADALSGFDATKVSFIGENSDKYSVIQQDNSLVLKSAIQSNTYVNSEYTAEITGTILPDGTYLEYGFNAFSTFAEGVAALGGADNTVTVTGGSFADSFELTTGNLSLADGVIVSGMVVGNGTNTITVDGNVSVSGIEGVKQITITTASLLSAGYIDLEDGTIYVTGSAVGSKEGNLTKIISTQAGVSGATLTGDPGFYVYAQGNDIYMLDLTRIYVDPNYTEAVTGTTAFTGDTLVWGVNAFAVPSSTNLANAAEVNNALVTGGTLFVLNWGTSGTQAGDIRPLKDVSIYAQGPTNFSIVFGNNGGNGHVVDGDVTITVDNTSTPQGGTAFIHSGSDDARWTFNGNVTVNFVGEGQVNTNTGFAITKRVNFGPEATLTLNIDGKRIENDVTFFRYANNGAFDSMKKVTINFNNVYGPNDKWLRLFSNGDGTGDNFTGTSLNAKDVEMNITNSWFRADSAQNWSIALTNGAEGSRNTNFTVHLSGATVDGLISGVRNRNQDSPGNTSVYEGTRTVYVDGGTNRLARLIMINHLVVDANASLVLTDRQGSYGNNVPYALHFLNSNSSGKNSITVDVSNYNGEDKMLVSAPRMGIAQRALTADEVDIVVAGDTEGKFIGGLGLTKGVFIITKNGDILYNSSITSEENGTAFGDTYVLIDDEDPTNSNAFNNFDDAKAAFDSHEAANPGRTFYVSGVDAGDAFYADGYAVTIIGGTYAYLYGTDDEAASVASASITITDGQFFELAVSDGTGTVTGDARIELAGGVYGTPAVYSYPEGDDPVLEEEEVLASIDGSNGNVGGTSTLVISKDLVADTKKADIVGSVTNFDSVEIAKGIANMVITNDMIVNAITIDASALLTVQGNLTAATITIDATTYEGPTKAIAVSDAFTSAAGQPAVTIDGDLETYDYKYVEDTLYLVSKNAGNVYLNSTWDESISGTIYNGELLVWGVNASNDMAFAVEKLTEDYTLFVTGGVFADTYTFGKATIDIRDEGTSIGGFVLGDGSSVTIAGVTSGASSIGTIVGAEGSTAGYAIVANSETAFGTISGIRDFTFTAAEGITVTGMDYLENGGSLTVDLTGYTQAADKVNILTTENGINNFIQLVDGETFSRTVIREANSDYQYGLYYDADTKSIVSVKLTEAGYLRRDANADENGTVVDGTTLVYGYNLHDGDPGVVAPHIISGGTLFAEGGSYWFFCGVPVNVQMNNVVANGVVMGYENSDQYHPATYQQPGKTREGDFTLYAVGSTFTWYTAFAGRGLANNRQTLIVANRVYNDPEDPEAGFQYEDGVYNLTFDGCRHDMNDFFVTDQANISGGTVNISFLNYDLRGDLQLFRNVYKYDGEYVKEINVTFENVSAPAAKWMWVWDPVESSNTKLTITVKDSTFIGTDHTLGFISGDGNRSWSGEGEVFISGFTTQGRLSGARGTGGGDASNITGDRTLFVSGENYVRVVRDFTTIDVAQDAGLLRTEEVRLAENAEIILRGEAGYTGDVKEFIVASGTVTGILRENAQFLDEEDDEIEGYGAAIGDKSVFIYKTEGDVFYNMDYTAAINGATVTDRDGKMNYLVFGDNAVASFADAINSVEERGGTEYATIQVENTMAKDFYTKGYTTVVNGGQITNLFGGNTPGSEKVVIDGETVTVPVAADPVDDADITVNKGAIVTNVTLASEYSQVNGDALLTVGDGAAFTGTLDGGADYVGGTSEVVFLGDATAAAITGFSNVTLSADGLVELSGAFSGTTITIDATDFADSTKKVLVAEGGFGDTTAITVTIEGGSGFGYEFLDDGKTLVITSTLVGDTFANTAWTEADVHNQFVGETALVWGQNAFNSFAAAAAAIGEGGTLNLDGGASTEAITLTKNNDVFVSANTEATSVGSLTADGGALTVDNDFTAAEISGFSAMNLTAGNTITVNGGIAMAENATITVDVTGYAQSDSDIVIISTESGIANIDTTTISVTGENDKIFYAFYDSTDSNVHLMRVDNFYVDTAFGTAGENIEPGQTNPITGEHLIFGVNAFYYLNDGLNAMKPGQCLYINGRIGNNINTGDRMGNIYITGSTVPVLINGYTSGDQVYTGGDVWLTVENSTFATAAGSFLFGTVTANEPWNHNQHILGNMTINVIGSTIGGDTGAILVSGMNFVNVLGTAEKAATITFNFVDTIIRDDFTFVGDSPLGKDETFQGVTRKGANLVMNFDNVLVPQAKWWRIMDGDQESTGTVTVSIKGSTIGDFGGENMRFSLGSWQWGDPRNHQDFNFTIEDSIINGYLQSSKHDDGNHAELVNFDGNKSITLKGDNIIRRIYWFDEITLTAGATLTGSGIRMASKGGVINVDITGYTGKSKVIVSMNNAFENVSAINVTKDEGSTYDVLTSDRAIVIKGAVKDLYVNSTYTAETCPAGTVYNDDLLFFGENAFATFAEAVPALTADAVLYVTGGDNLLDNAVWANSISIDASAKLSYSGSDVITINADLTNAGTFTISAAGFVDGSQADVVVLTANSITGAGSFATDDASYMIKVAGNEVHLVQKKSDVFVSSDWADLADGASVTVGDVTATIGLDAFATADAAIKAVSANGTITVVAGEEEVSFTSAIVSTVIAQNGAKVKAAVGTGSAVGSLTLQSGAVASNISVRAKGVLNVEAGAKVTGGLGMLSGAAVSFADGSVLDFDISGTTSGASAAVTNFSIITGAPNYTVTLVAGQAEGEYLLASDAASFNSSVTLMVGDTSIGSVAFGSSYTAGGYVYTLGLTDNNDLALTIEEGVLPDVPTLAYVNSEWTGLEDGEIVTVGAITAKIGYDAFATLSAGLAGVTDDGSVQVVGGEVSFADGYFKTITVCADATVVGTASFLNKPITIDGTMAFDLALTTRTSAQFSDIQFVSGNTQYTLTEASATGVYMLASGLWYDANYQPVFTGVVKIGDVELTVGNDVVIGGFSYGLRTTGNLELMLVVDNAVAPASDVSFIHASLDGVQNMIGKIFKSETAGIDSEIKFYTLDGNVYGMNDLIEDGWTFAGVGDFNGDGMDDMLRYNNTNGLVVSDNANGNGTFTPAVLNLKNASWDILGTGDFNGDGFDDVLVANRTAASATVGLLGYWSKGTEWTLINGYSDEWTLVDTGDYDGNGCCDMLWKNSFVGEGGLTYNAYCTWRLGDITGPDWSIVMVAKVNETETPDTDAWSYLTTGDFNGDGISDIAMINDVGTVAVATMAADGTSSAWTVLSVVDTSSWNLAGTTDLNLDGVDDIIWCQDEVAGVGSLSGYWQINADELNHPVMTAWQNIGWLA